MPDKTDKARMTRAEIRGRALTLFREQGFSATTMRAIARAARVSLGLAYYYYPSKTDILLEYYLERQTEILESVRASWRPGLDLRQGLEGAIHRQLAALSPDRDILTALLAEILLPDSPLFLFGARSAELRNQNIAIYAEIWRGHISAEFLPLAANLSWLSQMLVVYIALVRENDPQSVESTLGQMLDTLPYLVKMTRFPWSALLRRVNSVLAGLWR